MIIDVKKTLHLVTQILKRGLVIFLPVFLSTAAPGQTPPQIPYLQKQASGSMQLIVNGNPLLMLGGELGNSNASDLKYMEWIWPRLDSIGLNTVLVPVYWELLEAQPGKYDFTLVDGAVKKAREHRLHLVLLWFGSWKNSMSCYVPLWVKKDQQRFPRAVNKEGKALEMLSAFSLENRNTDARAFSELMKHIRQTDQQEQTVVMVQVENEIGMIPQARDCSKQANEAFAKPLAAELIAYLHKNKDRLMPEFNQLWEKNGRRSAGTWQEMFGSGPAAEEIFTAWHYASYVNYIAEQGKSEYALPMYVNAALIRPGYEPGQYPSGGPLPHLLDIWRAAAPAVDFLAPDIYFPNFSEWCQKYHQSGNPLFIPEAALDANAAVNALYAFGEHQAMGFCPFSIEYLADPQNARLSKVYDLLRQMSPLILASQGTGTIRGFLLDEQNQTDTVQLGDYSFNIAHDYTFPWTKRTESPWPRVGGLIISISADEFYIAGSGVIVTFEKRVAGETIVGIGSIDEGKFVEGSWVPGRRLNGDQSHQGRHLRLPNGEVGIQRVKLYTY